MYLFVYKTTHENGRYYIGRHQTTILEDNYFGSGKWVVGIKDKSKLTRTILQYANNLEELYELEEYYIDLNWSNPLCMNMKKGSIGNTSEDAKLINYRKVSSGEHHWMKRSDGTSWTQELNYLRIENGVHNFLKREDGSSFSSDRVSNGTHNWLKREDGSSSGSDIAKKQVTENRHPFQKRKDGTSIQTDKVKDGSHSLLKRPDGTSIGRDITIKRVQEGTHNFKNKVSCYNKDGVCKQIPKDEYFSQSGPKSDWEWVQIKSKEAILRKLKRNSN